MDQYSVEDQNTQKVNTTESTKPKSKCTYCNKTYQTNSSRRRHEQRCLGLPKNSANDIAPPPTATDKTLTCCICSKSLKNLASKIAHEKKHQSPGGFKCRYCQETFISDSARLLHLQSVHNEYRCQLCDGKFTELEPYQNHIKSAINCKERILHDATYITCKDCGAQFKTPVHLKAHNQSKCGTIKTYLCKICDAKFMTLNTLNVHMLIHKGEKKHLCNFCGNSFLSKGQLKVHERCHTGEKPFKCDVCSKAFSYRESLVTHSSLHTGIKPYMCEACGNRFSCIGNLIKHRRSRPNSCGLPQYSKNVKVAPRASARSIENLSLKAANKKAGNINKSSASAEKRSNGIVQTIVSEMPTTIVATKQRKRKATSRKAIQILNTIPPLNILTNTLQSNDQHQQQQQHSAANGIKMENPVDINALLNCNQIEIIETKQEDDQIMTNNNTLNQQQQQQMITIVTSNDNYQHTSTTGSNTTETILSTDEQLLQHQQHHIVSNVEIEYITNTTLVVGKSATAEHYEIHYDSGEIINPPVVDESTNSYQITQWSNGGGDDHPDNTNNENVIDDDILLDNNNVDNDDDNDDGGGGGNDEVILSDNCYLTNDNDYDHDYAMETTTTDEINDNEQQLCEYSTISEQQENELIQMSDPIAIVENVNIIQNENEIEIVITDQDGNNLNIMPQDFIPIAVQDNNQKYEIFSAGDYIVTTSSYENAETTLEEAQNCQALAVNFTDDEIIYKCDHCPRQYMHQKPFVKHLKTEHGIVYKISLSAVKKRRPLSTGGKIHSTKAVYACKICLKEYSSVTVLKKHEMRHGDDGMLIHKCVCCLTYFATLAEVEQHQLSVHDDKLSCRQCNKTFKEPDSLNSHIRYVHDRSTTTTTTNSRETNATKKYLYVCQQCGRNFAAKIALSDHERSECGKQPIYKCNVCDKSYHSAGSLKTHQTVHTGVLAHLCKHCGKAFRTQGQVKVHERSHTGSKPFKCEFCEKAFSYRESLLTHLSLHTGVKRFMCQACGNRFSCISNLQAHRKSHRSTCGLVPNMTKPVTTDGTKIKIGVAAVKKSSAAAAAEKC